MNRREAILTLGAGAISALGAYRLREALMSNTSTKYDGPEMPALFLGHGSPMNAITENEYSKAFQKLGRDLPKPKSILVISAHWMTKGTWITHMANPKTIHDFYGFPQELFDVQYPAPGNPELAESVQQLMTEPKIELDSDKWGLDHGTWSVLRHLYPGADIPVLQLSLDMSKPAQFHFELGQKIASLRKQGVLIVGSGNIVHNLRKIVWEDSAPAFDWAIEYDAWAKALITDRDFKPLIDSPVESQAGKLSVPTMDHYLPLLYVLGAARTKDELAFDIEGFQNGSISMRSVRFG